MAPVFASSAGALAGVMQGAVLADPRTELIVGDRATGRFVFAATTRLLRFVDEIDMAILPLVSGASAFALYSRSRAGYSDLGVNAARGERILARIAERLTKAA